MVTAIVKWKDEYKEDFINLSIEWLEKYVRVEPADEEILYHPYESILNDGGMIFFAQQDGVNIGTVSMINMGGGAYELAKLAVTESFKGQHISDLLMETALAYAKEKDAKKVILFTNSNLIPAIGLYHKYGFVDIPVTDNEYEEADMKMELSLAAAK
jgi:ribosomal protein S18 acetylase RimI-like enzyme